ncbi:MAG: ArsR family transcriptional regulator [Actinobacteria bacterium HGW-Actinobacteria-5]|jgi:protein-tyrosine-phosphatase|nr:MAG: ArsR family transcriptional regulator [Actinobacteria bacterium HGW-Actinobacteria-5]
MSNGLEERARAYAALGEASRLAIIDRLALGDLASGELAAGLGLPTNLMAHHLQVLEQAGLVERRRSEGDGRRAYVRRTAACNRLLGSDATPRPHRVAFVCSANSARSQLAEAYWRTVSDIPVVSAGTHPARRVHPRAVTVARHHGLDLVGATPKLVDDVLTGDELLITVCDRAYEGLRAPSAHWSIPDPARSADSRAFESAFTDIADRIDRLTSRFEGEAS